MFMAAPACQFFQIMENIENGTMEPNLWFLPQCNEVLSLRNLYTKVVIFWQTSEINIFSLFQNLFFANVLKYITKQLNNKYDKVREW